MVEGLARMGAWAAAFSASAAERMIPANRAVRALLFHGIGLSSWKPKPRVAAKVVTAIYKLKQQAAQSRTGRRETDDIIKVYSHLAADAGA